MTNIGNLRKQIDNVSDLLSTYQQPGGTKTIAQDLGAISFRHHLNELRQKLETELQIRNKEIVEISLDGNGRESAGSIRLGLLAKIATNFGGAVQQAGRFKRYGTSGKHIPRDIVDSMDLRLAGLEAASTHLFITARIEPDVFGRSLAEDALKTTFSILLSSESPELLTEAVAAAGASAASAVGNLAKEVAKSDHSLSVRWRSPEDSEFFWSASPEGLRELAASLDAIEQSEPEVITIGGKVITVSLREPFVIEDDKGIAYPATFSVDMLPKLESITVNTRIVASMLRTSVTNRLTGRAKYSYRLTEITPS